MAGKAKLRRENSVDVTDRFKQGDARLRIIQKNRLKFTDARDRLAQMAKKTDARSKILKLRKVREDDRTLNVGSVRPVGSSILLKTDHNGKISLSTNKNKKKLPTHMNIAIRKELGLLTNKRKFSMLPKREIMEQRQRGNTKPTYRSLVHSLDVSNDGYSRDVEMLNAFTPPTIKRTIRNDVMREMLPLSEFSHSGSVDPNLYTWVRPSEAHNLKGPIKSSVHEGFRQSVEVTARNNFLMESSNDWNYVDPSVRSIKLSSMRIGENIEDNSLRPITSSRLKTGVHARLDTPPLKVQSQGIFGQTKTKIIVPLGHRIVVSNLQPTVTKDDIRELFEDIGELLVSRLVRPGTAEVIYKNLKDAQKAVDTYHNRQLDGQPMKCLLVNKRPINNPTAPAVRPTKIISNVLRSTYGVNKESVPIIKSSKLIPDIGTIHKVLFHKT